MRKEAAVSFVDIQIFLKPFSVKIVLYSQDERNNNPSDYDVSATPEGTLLRRSVTFDSKKIGSVETGMNRVFAPKP